MATSVAVLHIALLSGRSEAFAVDLGSTVEELQTRARKSFGQGEVGEIFSKVDHETMVKPWLNHGETMVKPWLNG